MHIVMHALLCLFRLGVTALYCSTLSVSEMRDSIADGLVQYLTFGNYAGRAIRSAVETYLPSCRLSDL